MKASIWKQISLLSKDKILSKSIYSITHRIIIQKHQIKNRKKMIFKNIIQLMLYVFVRILKKLLPEITNITNVKIARVITINYA